MDEATLLRVVRGFPEEIHHDVLVAADLVEPPAHAMTPRAERVSVQDEDVEIPYRIYNPVPPNRSLRRLPDRSRLVAGCIYSRHHDGYVRESACAQIVASAEPWVVPYVIRLLGEYVVEISALILQRLTEQSAFSWSGYVRFARANEDYLALTEQRAISYWACYYRHAYARDEYPALVALDKLRRGASESA